MTGAVARFALAGLAAMAIVGVVSFLVMRDTGTSEALSNARDVTRIVGDGIVEPNLTEGLIRGRPGAVARFNRIVRRRVLQDPIERIKLWTPAGRLVYSDEPRLIGEQYQLGADELAVLRTGDVESDISDLSRPENRFEQGRGKLLEVYLPVRSPAGRPLLFEAYQRFDSIASSGRDIWLAFAPALIAALIVLELVQLPLAASMARRIRRGAEEQARLLRRAVDASENERRRIAGDLHDGIVQDLAGLSYSLAAAADKAEATNPDAADSLRSGADQARQGVRQLRGLLVEIYPPRLRDAGLAAAVEDLLSPLTARGVETAVDIPGNLAVEPETEALLFRIAQESIRNAAKHSEASRVTVRTSLEDEWVTLEVADNGAGFSTEQPNEVREGHLGLDLMRRLTEEADGELEIETAPGRGTRVRLNLRREEAA